MEIKPFVRKANYYETDQMGIIHHSNYIRWFEEARIDFMEQIGFGYENSVNAGIDIAVLEVVCRYKGMVKFGDTVDIYVRIKEITPAKMSVAYKITDHANGELRTTGESLHCFMGPDHRIVRLNRTVPELYELFASMAEKTD